MCWNTIVSFPSAGGMMILTLSDSSGDSDGKESACNARDPVLIPGLERSPEEGNGNPIQFSGLEIPSDREA